MRSEIFPDRISCVSKSDSTRFVHLLNRACIQYRAPCARKEAGGKADVRTAHATAGCTNLMHLGLVPEECTGQVSSFLADFFRSLLPTLGTPTFAILYASSAPAQQGDHETTARFS